MKKRRGPQYVILREYHGEPVGEEGAPEEKETVIGFSSRDERFVIDTQEGAIMRWLLQHPHFELDWATARREGRGRPKVVHVVGTLPIGCLKLSLVPRRDPRHCYILGRGSGGGKTPAHGKRSAYSDAQKLADSGGGIGNNLRGSEEPKNRASGLVEVCGA